MQEAEYSAMVEDEELALDQQTQAPQGLKPQGRMYRLKRAVRSCTCVGLWLCIGACFADTARAHITSVMVGIMSVATAVVEVGWWVIGAVSVLLVGHAFHFWRLGGYR